MTIELMKQWLEALMAVELHLCEVGQRGNGLHRQVCESITSICMALDQAEKQEPVAWIDGGDLELMSKHGRGCIAWGTQQNNANTPLYTTPPAAPVQEPVGWVNHANIASAVVERERGGSGDTHTWSESKTAYHTVPFYTTPQPQREWVGLTDEDVVNLVDDEDWYNDPEGFVKIVEAKLKEKNT